jgi:3-isopropylmalate/(R)-2-methylmalate dehydratase small subunit
MKWTYCGRAWVFGDDLGIDGDIMPLRFALARETDPEILCKHLLTGVDPDFPNKARPGDVIVAGRRFGQGNPHIQGLLGIRGFGLGLIAESIPSGTYRNAIAAGLTFLPRCPKVRELVSAGDEIEVDFRTGRVANLSTRQIDQFPPLPPELRDIVENGGWPKHFRNRLDSMREQSGQMRVSQ